MGYFKKRKGGNRGGNGANNGAGDQHGNETKRQKTEGRKPRELAEGEVREERKPKRKVACMIGYCGTGYHGMQMNPPHKTIEGELFEAFCKAGAISKDNADDPKKSSFIRAARTDKGVHAGGNVVSLKLIIEDPEIVSKINAELPDAIRVWGFSRTNKSFECRKMCGSRIYEYMIPSYSFLPPKRTSALWERITQAAEEKGESVPEDKEGDEFWANVKKELADAGFADDQINKVDQEEAEAAHAFEKSEEKSESSEENSENADKPQGRVITETERQIKAIENKCRRAYRIAPERLEKIRKAFEVYHGQHNFHNFTIGKPFNDPSANRFMKSLTVSDPVIINGTEWLSIKIHGQSFMLHQIRKMVAMAALVVRANAPIERIKEAFGPKRINIPKAPSLGLLLERPVYDGYNSRLGEFGYEPINFDKFNDEIEAFKMKYIYDKIYSEEASDNVFHGFFAFIDSFRGDPIFDYLTCKGIQDLGNTKVKIDRDDEDELVGDIEG